MRIFPPVFPARRKGEIVRHWSVQRSEALEVGNASLLEASRRSWKEGGAISQERYKGTQSAKSLSSVFFLVVVVFFFFFWWSSSRGLGGRKSGESLGLGL